MILKSVMKLKREQLYQYYAYGDFKSRLIHEVFKNCLEFENYCITHDILFRVDIELDRPEQMKLFKAEEI